MPEKEGEGNLLLKKAKRASRRRSDKKKKGVGDGHAFKNRDYWGEVTNRINFRKKKRVSGLVECRGRNEHKKTLRSERKIEKGISRPSRDVLQKLRDMTWAITEN